MLSFTYDQLLLIKVEKLTSLYSVNVKYCSKLKSYTSLLIFYVQTLICDTFWFKKIIIKKSKLKKVSKDDVCRKTHDHSE